MINIDKGGIENIYIYVADALRFDFLPGEMRDKYPFVKTISSGLSSPAAFSSIITGRYPPQHGVWGFQNQLNSRLSTIFGFDINSYFVGGGGEVGEVLGASSHLPTEVVSAKYNLEPTLIDPTPPFLVLERDILTHAPFAESFSQDDNQFESHEEYWNARKDQPTQLIADYEKAAQLTYERFERRLQSLEDEGILNNTLVIFTADHGDFLGEFGLVGHGNLSAPPLVYVPTVFCHPSISVNGSVMAHIDLAPTLSDLFGDGIFDKSELPGYSLLGSIPEQRMIFNGTTGYGRDEWSAWDRNGGWAFSDGNIINWLEWVYGKSFVAEESVFSRKRPHKLIMTALSRGVSKGTKVGDPNFTYDEANEFCDSILDTSIETIRREIPEESKHRLQRMGYLDE